MTGNSERIKLLYICSSQFSGSTLTSFLLNLHDEVATIGHTTGWQYSDEEDFRCSCGEKIRECPLFRTVEARFIEHGLPFDPRNFGTAFRLVGSPRVNQLLTGAIKGVSSSRLEIWRDGLVAAIPAFRRRLARQRAANFVLMQTVLQFLGAGVYLDNSHSPHRLRCLSSDPRFDARPIHLIRDPRGVSLSLMTNSGLTVEDAIDSWLRHQLAIFRIAREIREPLLLSYEKLCTDTNGQLAAIQRFAGITQETYAGDFKSREHHILGNRMRLSSGEIKLDERWRRDLGEPDRRTIETRLRSFVDGNSDHPLSAIIGDYVDATTSPAC
jgi:hypothetical protein